jgi:hypothetical protein
MLHGIFERSQCRVRSAQCAEPVTIGGGGFQPHAGKSEPVELTGVKLTFGGLLALVYQIERRLSLIQFPQGRAVIDKASFHVSDGACLRA